MGNAVLVLASQVFLVRKVVGKDAGTLYAMKVLKKATLKSEYGIAVQFLGFLLYLKP